jgi:hypothetical protein
MRVLVFGLILLSTFSCAKGTSTSSSSLVEQASTTDCAAMLQGLSAAGAKLADIERLDASQLEVTWTLASNEQSAMCATDPQGKWNEIVRASWPDPNH